MCLKRVEKKKLSGRHNNDTSLNTFAKWLFNCIPEKWDPGLETRDPYVGPRTQDSAPETRDS